MINLTRRNLLTAASVLPLIATLPRGAFAAGDETLKIAIASETGDLDLLQNVSALSAYTVVFDALIHYGPGGVLEPGLATAWKVAADDKSISFDLRKGVTFSDGTPFDAAAAEWNLKRWMGVEDFSWIGIADAYDSITIDGPNKININLKRPVPAGMLELTIVRPVRFLSPKAVNADGAQSSPVGTGPWVVESYDSARTVLVRNENYWGEKPFFAKIELIVVPDELARANGLRSGELDVIGGDWVATLSPRRARALEAEGMSVVAEPGTAAIHLGFSPESLLVQDIGVRKAVFNGIDRATIAKVLFEGFADPVADVFPAIIPLSGNRHDVPARSVAVAKAALAESGWIEESGGWTKDGTALTLNLLVSEESLPGSRRIAEIVQGMLSEVGVGVKVSSVDNATMHERRPAFDYDLAFFTTYGAPYDPHGSLGASFLTSTDTGPDGKIYVSDELDPIVVAALEASGPEGEAKTQAIYDWLWDNVAICPLVVQQRIWAHGPRLKGFSLPATDYDLPFKGISV
jgi:nickel transport system substrate-binding protein